MSAHISTITCLTENLVWLNHILKIYLYFDAKGSPGHTNFSSHLVIINGAV